MAGYGGIIGKLQTSIFNGSGRELQGALMYSGIGAGIGAVGGALTSDDGVGSGIMRGGMLGAGIGAAANLLPKAVASTYKRHNLKSIDKSTLDSGILDIADAYSGFMNKQSESGTVLGGLFTSGAIPKGAHLKNDAEFIQMATDALQGNVNKGSSKMSKKMSKVSKGLGQNPDGTDRTFADVFTKEFADYYRETSNAKLSGDAKLAASKDGSALANTIKENLASFKNASTMGKAEIGSAVGAKAGFDSVYHHLVEPTGSLIRKVRGIDKGKITGEEYAATAFNAFGAYEIGNIMNDTADGDYGGALKSAAILGVGKLAYAQGVNLFKLNKIRKDYNIPMDFVGQKAVQGASAAFTTIAGGANTVRFNKMMNNDSTFNTFKSGLKDTQVGDNLGFSKNIVGGAKIPDGFIGNNKSTILDKVQEMRTGYKTGKPVPTFNVGDMITDMNNAKLTAQNFKQNFPNYLNTAKAVGASAGNAVGSTFGRATP